VILDTLANAARYAAVHPRFAAAFDFLARPSTASLPEGRHDIDGDRLFVLVERRDGRGREGATLETHRRYIDIQVTLEGLEEIGWAPLAALRPPRGGYDDGKDIAFFDDRPTTWVGVPPGHFVIFFPQDAHAPLAGRGQLRKAIVKVAVE
jgi:YhcH/YjgK/YiaL family protein